VVGVSVKDAPTLAVGNPLAVARLEIEAMTGKQLTALVGEQARVMKTRTWSADHLLSVVESVIRERQVKAA
jgi:hypothetical protein